MVFSRQWNLDGNGESHLRRKRDSRRRQLRLELLEDRRVLTGELVELSYQFFALNPDGSTGRNLDPNPNDSVLQANVYVGEKFVVRTLAKDLRQPTPQGVFSVYTDLNYTNVDGSASEKIQVQWGEYNLITIGDSALAGSFRLQYGNETTTAIPLAVETAPDGAQEIDRVAMAGNIQSAIEALPSVGPGNVIVTTKVNSRYNVLFRKDLARTDIPDPVVVNNLVNTGGANPGSVQVQATGTTNASAESALVLESAINRSPSVNPSYAYSNGGGKGFLEDLTSTIPGKRVLREVGGISDVTSVPSAIASSFLAANDLTFVAAQAGQVQIETTLPVLPTPPQQGLGVLLFGAGFTYFLTSNEVILPTALITIIDGLIAVNDQTTVNEDSSTNVLDVLANDLDPTGTSRSIISVSQPSTGGSVSIATSGSELIFTPSANFFGTAVSTYTVRNNL
ncbi:MAG: Ig-like domain-containing protein, partial [Pirellula sp.]